MAPYHLDADQHEGWHQERQPAPQLPEDHAPEPFSLKRLALSVLAIAIVSAMLMVQVPSDAAEGATHSTTLGSKLVTAVGVVADAIRSFAPKNLYEKGGAEGNLQGTANASNQTDPTPIPTPDFGACGCERAYKPVCGRDGITYNNTCFATCAGVIIAAADDCVTAKTATPRPVVAPYGTPVPS